MTPTSESERREVAEMLRGAAHRHDAIECGSVTNMLGLKYEIYGSVVAFSSDAVSRLADLIDPTCEVESVEPIRAGEFNQAIGSAFHLTCGHTAWRACTDEPPVYCEECGARVVDDD